jgi:hypothetical protein
MLEVLARPAAQQPGPSDPWSAADRDTMRAIGEKLCDDYEARGLTGRPIFWRRDRARILADLMRFLAADTAHRRAHGTRPLAAELAFGLRQAELEAVPLELPDGRCVRFRGKADRVDVADDGTLHIVDYKTGSMHGFEHLGVDDPDLGGRKLQLAVYGVAARLHHLSPDAPVLAEYWFVSGKGNFKRVGYPVTPAILERVGRTLATIVGGIEAGVFPNHPSTAVSTTPFIECRYCDPDGMGVTELRRQWDRKRDDPLLASFAELAEPLAGVEPVVEPVVIEEVPNG